MDLPSLRRPSSSSHPLRGGCLTGVERLVKVLATVRHDNSMDPDIQYPPGQGVPQWKVTVQIPGTVISEVSGAPGSRYQPAL